MFQIECINSKNQICYEDEAKTFNEAMIKINSFRISYSNINLYKNGIKIDY